MRKKLSKLSLASETIVALDGNTLETVRGGAPVETEPYSFCGLCIPVTKSYAKDC